MTSLSRSLPEPVDSSDVARRLRTWIGRPQSTWIIFSVLAALVWLPRLILRSFWVDEAGTFWMAHNGVIAAVQKTWHWPGQSVLYSAIASFFCLNSGPLREFVLRIPTLLGMVAAGYFLYRLAESAIGKGAGLPAVAIFAFVPTSIVLGTEARPYGLAVGAAAASTWFLYRYRETSSGKDLAKYIAASTLILYFHYFFAVVFCVHLAYLLHASLLARLPVRWTRIIGAWFAVGVLALPLLPHMLLIAREAHTFQYSRKPMVLELIGDVLPMLLAFGLFLSALLVQFLFPGMLRRAAPLTRPDTVLALMLWLLGPVLLFALSLAVSGNFFFDRYFGYALLGQALVLAYAGWSVFESEAARVWVLLAAILSTASPLAMAAGFHSGQEDLAPMLNIIRTESSRGNLPPVFFSSPLPESNFLNWKAGVAKTYLYAPFVAYPIPNRVLPLPYLPAEDAKQYISNTIESQLTHTREVIFATHRANFSVWVPWMMARMQQAGFTGQVEQPNSYTVLIFRRP